LTPQHSSSLLPSIIPTAATEGARMQGIGSGNSIPEYVPVEGFMAMIDAVKEIRSREAR
jgi:hypothetical protein